MNYCLLPKKKNGPNYYLFYVVITPSGAEEVADEISERRLLFTESSSDQQAVDMCTKFQEEEWCMCESLGKKFFMGSLIAVEKGMVREIKTEIPVSVQEY